MLIKKSKFKQLKGCFWIQVFPTHANIYLEVFGDRMRVLCPCSCSRPWHVVALCFSCACFALLCVPTVFVNFAVSGVWCCPCHWNETCVFLSGMIWNILDPCLRFGLSKQVLTIQMVHSRSQVEAATGWKPWNKVKNICKYGKSSSNFFKNLFLNQGKNEKGTYFHSSSFQSTKYAS